MTPRCTGKALALIALLAVLTATAPPAAAQQVGTIRGSITDAATQRPLAGAQVSLPGTGRGALTNNNGAFLLVGVPPGSHTVRVTMIGYEPAERTVTLAAGQSLAVDFALRETAVALEELIVTATGQARKKEIGTSLTTITTAEIKPGAIAQPQELLVARATGAFVMANSGQPGTGGTIRLRGNNSVTQGNAPIIYVDGVRIYNGSTPTTQGGRQSTIGLNDINPADIERVEIVKGPAATTLYGTEASGGVIQLFTKRGGTGEGDQRASWTGEVSLGFNKMGHVGPEDDKYGMFVNKCDGVLETGDGVKFVELSCPKSGTWLVNGPIQRYSLSVRGGMGDLSYYLSGHFGDEKGVIEPGGLRDGGFRGNFSFSPMERLVFSLNSSYTKRDVQWIPDGNNGSGFLLNVSRGPDGNFQLARGEKYRGWECDPSLPADVRCTINAAIRDSESTTRADHFITGFTVSFDPFDWFRNRVSVGYDYNHAIMETYNPFGFPRVPKGDLRTENWTNKLLTVDYAGTLRHTFRGAFTSDFSFGAQMFERRVRSTEIFAEQFSGPGEATLESAAIATLVDDTRFREVNAGFFLQEVVGWKDRLFVTAGMRVDGNSAFGKDYNLEPYPKLSASYVISDHEFWPEQWIEAAKLRAAVGESGKAPGAFDAVKTWAPIAGDDGQPGFTPSQLGNPKLGPERTREYEAGFELSALAGRIGVDFSVYRQDTYDALISIVYPPSQGFSNRQLENVGELRTTGYEARIDLGLVRTPTIDWSARLNISKINSEALDIGGETYVVNTLARSQVVEGYPVPSYFGKKVMNANEYAEPIIRGTGEDGDPAQFLGSTWPDRLIALSTSVTLFNRLTLDALGEWQLGGHLLNAVGYQNANKGEWQPCHAPWAAMQAAAAGDSSALRKVTALDRVRCSRTSGVRDYDFWIEATDFFKLRSVSLTYEVPEGLIPRAHGATITLSGRNLWLSSDYSGSDPEITDFRDNSTSRRDYYVFPPSRQFLATVRFHF